MNTAHLWIVFCKIRAGVGTHAHATAKFDWTLKTDPRGRACALALGLPIPALNGHRGILGFFF